MVNMAASPTVENTETPIKKGRGQYERKAKRGSYQKHKTEKKIIVKHYLNTRLKGKNEEFPLYVQITFNGKTHNLKSQIPMDFTESYFNEIINDPMIFQHIEYNFLFAREKGLIEYVFQNDYQNHITLFGSIPPNAELIKSYDVNNCFSLYNYNDYLIEKQVNHALKVEILRFVIKKYINKISNVELNTEKISQYVNENYSEIINSIKISNSSISAIQLLNFYEKKNQEFSELRKNFSSEIWWFDVYMQQFRYNATNSVFYTALETTLLDYIKGSFKEKFLACNSNSSESKMILDDIHKFITNDSFNSLDIRSIVAGNDMMSFIKKTHLYSQNSSEISSEEVFKDAVSLLKNILFDK